MQKFINAAPNYRDRCLIRVLADTGMLRAELSALDIRDVDFENLRMTIRSGKGGKQRIVPATEALQQILGHASIATTVDSYGRLSVDDIQEHCQQLMSENED